MNSDERPSWLRLPPHCTFCDSWDFHRFAESLLRDIRSGSVLEDAGKARLAEYINIRRAEHEAGIVEKRQRVIKAKVPPEFREPVDRTQIGDTVAWDRVQAWDPGSGRGLVLFGPSGLGKTRSVYYRLSELHLRTGLEFAALTAGKLKRLSCATFSDDAYSSREEQLSDLATVQVVFLDDLSQSVLSGAYAERLFELVAERTNYGRPLICTVQCDGDELAKRIAGYDNRYLDSAVAIIRRLRDFCDSIPFR